MGNQSSSEQTNATEQNQQQTMDPYQQQMPPQQYQQQQAPPQQYQQQSMNFLQQQQAQQYQQPSLNSYNAYMPNVFSSNCCPPAFQTTANALPKRIPTKGYDKDKAVCAVILTVNDGGSFDELFRAVEQVPPEDEVAISLWNMSFGNLRALEKKLDKNQTSTKEAKESRELETLLDEIASDINRAEPQSVLLNFECCGGFSENAVPGNDKAAFNRIIRLFLDRGHNVNTGDFSTKALISVWNETILGPNPFVRCGTCSSGLTLNFSKKTLQECPSSQLQQVAELSDKGEARLKAMGSTCLFSVNHAKSDNNVYALEVLTVVSSVDHNCSVSNRDCEVDADGLGVRRGCAGHVLLTYPSGGNMVVSSGHWIELSRLDTSVEMVARNMENQFGAAKAAEFQSNYASFGIAEQQSYLQQNAAMCVQSCAPVSYGNVSKSSFQKKC